MRCPFGIPGPRQIKGVPKVCSYMFFFPRRPWLSLQIIATISRSLCQYPLVTDPVTWPGLRQSSYECLRLLSRGVNMTKRSSICSQSACDIQIVVGVAVVSAVQMTLFAKWTADSGAW